MSKLFIKFSLKRFFLALTISVMMIVFCLTLGVSKSLAVENPQCGTTKNTCIIGTNGGLTYDSASGCWAWSCSVGLQTIPCQTCVGCGNNRVSTGEQCDGSDLNNQSCISLGYVAGTLRCNVDCTFDASNCLVVVEPPANECGNGILDPGEECESNSPFSCAEGEVCENCKCKVIDINSSSINCDDNNNDGLPDNPVYSDWSPVKTGNKPCPGCGDANKKVLSAKPTTGLCKGLGNLNSSGVSDVFYNPYTTDYGLRDNDYFTHNDTLAKWTWTCSNSEFSVNCEAYPASECNKDISAQDKCDATSAPSFDTRLDMFSKRDKKTSGDRYCKFGKLFISAQLLQSCSWDTTFNTNWQCVGLSDGEASPADSTVNNVDCSSKWAGKPKCGYLNKIESVSATDEYWTPQTTNNCWAEPFFSLKTNATYTTDPNAFCDGDGGSELVSGVNLTQDENNRRATWNWTCRGDNNQTVSCSTTIQDTCLNGICGTDDGKTFPPGEPGSSGGYSGFCQRGEVVINDQYPSSDGYYRWLCRGDEGAGDDECSARIVGQCGPVNHKTLMAQNTDNYGILNTMPLSQLCSVGNLVRLEQTGSLDGCGRFRNNSYIIYFGGAAGRDNLCIGVWNWSCGTANNKVDCDAVEEYPICGYAGSAPDTVRFSTREAIKNYGYAGYGDCSRGNHPLLSEITLTGDTWNWSCDIHGQDYTGTEEKYYNTAGASVNCDAKYGN